jgi:chemotaxis protein methyltransferase CheR
MAISNSTFQYLQQLIRSWSGIHVSDKDKYLVEARLLPLTRQHQAPSVEDLIGRVRDGSADGLGSVIRDALLPKETNFFRDQYPFELLRSKIFPTLEAQPLS